MNTSLNININNYKELKKIDNTKLNDEILRIFNTGYKLLYPEEIIHNRIETINHIEIINKLNQLSTNVSSNNIEIKVDELKKVISKLLGISYTSTKKGEISENTIEQIIKSRYGNIIYEKTRHIPHSGDAWLNFESGQKIMLEVKNYTNTVPKDEMIKFKNDMKHHNIYWGLFISINSDIQGHKTLDYKQFIYNNITYHQIFISFLMKDIHRLDIAFSILRNLFNNNEQNVTILNKAKQQISEQLEDLDKIWKKNYILRESFRKMDKNIKNSLDEYYSELREYQFQMELCLKKTTNNINSVFTNIENIKNVKANILEKYNNYKIFIPLTKIIDIYNDDDYIFIENMKNYNLYYKDTNIGTIKIAQKRITLNLINPNLTLYFGADTNRTNDTNIDLIKNFQNNIWI